MKLACSRCGRPIATTGTPAAGRVYRIPCKCGGMVIQRGEAAQAAQRSVMAPALPDEPAFVREVRTSEEPEVDVALDPDGMPTDAELAPALRERSARSEQVFDYASSDWVPLGWALRRVRMHALLSGLAGGAVVAIVLLAWQSYATRGPPPIAAATAAVPEAQVEAAPIVERATPTPGAALRRSAAAAPRAPKDGEPGLAGDSTGSGWIQVEDSADSEEATPGREAARDADATLAETPDGGSATSSERAPDEVTAGADAQGVEEAPGDVPSGELTAGAESAEPAADPGTAPSETVPATGHAPDAHEVAAALRDRRAELEACVVEANAARGAGPEHPRRLSFVVVVDPSGRVSNALLDDKPGDSTPLGACLLRIAKAVSFTPFEGDPTHVRLALSHTPR